MVDVSRLLCEQDVAEGVIRLLERVAGRLLRV